VSAAQFDVWEARKQAIRAEVVAYDAFIARGSMHAAREHGELRLEGKEYVVQDGDIINFRFAT
jgi:ribosome-binding ATPase YchF (GTP1/OBG family)